MFWYSRLSAIVTDDGVLYCRAAQVSLAFLLASAAAPKLGLLGKAQALFTSFRPAYWQVC